MMIIPENSSSLFLKTSFDVIQNNWYGVRIFAVLKQYLQNNYSNARLITTGAFVVIMLM